MAISAKAVKELRELTNAPMMECKKALTDADGDIQGAIKVLRERGIAKMAKRADRETSEGVIRIAVGEGGRPGTAVVVTCETDFTSSNEKFTTLADAAMHSAQSVLGSDPTPDQVLDGAGPDGKPVRETLEGVANAIRENMGIAKVIRYEGACGQYVHFNGKSGALVEVELGDDSKAGSAELNSLLRDVCMHIVSVVPSPLAVAKEGIDEKVVAEEREILIKQAVDSGKPQEIAEKMVEGRMKKFYSERALIEQDFIKDPSKTVSAQVQSVAKDLGTTIEVTRFERLAIGE